MNPLTMIPKRIRATLYLTGLLLGVLIGALSAGFAQLGDDRPHWLVFAAAVWAYVVGPSGLVLALSNMKTADLTPVTAELVAHEIPDGAELERRVNQNRKATGSPPLA